MKKNSAAKWIIVLTVAGLLSMGTVAVADWDRGPGFGPCWGDDTRGGGWGQGERGGRHWMANLTDEEVEKIKEARQAFFDASDELRRAARQKRLELRAELAKNTPDSEKAMALQQELSGIKAQMGQKRIEHLLKLKADYPDADQWLKGRGAKKFRGAGGRGYGGCGRW